MKKSPNMPYISDNSDSQNSYSLIQLISKITPENKHTEISWGKQLGKEIIEYAESPVIKKPIAKNT